jgi:head-tail adaptor
MGLMLGAADLEWMQAMQQRAMPGTVVIERRTLAADAMGGMTETWAAVGTVSGRIYPQNVRSMTEPIAGAQIAEQSRWFATFPVGTDVLASDRLLYATRTWEVIRVANDEMWQTAVRCEVTTYNEERRV